MKPNSQRIYNLLFSSVYPLYIQKVERKWRTKEEVDTVVFWMTWYDSAWLEDQLTRKTTFETFFAEAPAMNPNISKITWVICGRRVEDIEDPLIQLIRYLDKLIDELAKWKAMEKILRK